MNENINFYYDFCRARLPNVAAPQRSLTTPTKGGARGGNALDAEIFFWIFVCFCAGKVLYFVKNDYIITHGFCE